MFAALQAHETSKLLLNWCQAHRYIATGIKITTAGTYSTSICYIIDRVKWYCAANRFGDMVNIHIVHYFVTIKL